MKLQWDIMYSHSRDVQMPTSCGSLSSHETDIIGGSPIRPCVTDIMLQLDGPASIRARRRPAQELVQRTCYNTQSRISG